MKLTTTMKSFIVLSALLAQTPALRADEDHEKNHPCKEIAKACEAAGFKKGDHKDKKGLWKDCVDPILEGTAVPGDGFARKHRRL